VPRTATSAATAAAARSPATASSTASARPATTAAISAAVWTISMGTIAVRTLRTTVSTRGCSLLSITIEVGFVVGEISAAFDGQRGRTGDFAVGPRAPVSSRFAATHLCPLFFENGLARKPNAIALNRKHFHQHLVAFLEFIADVRDAMLSHFADVEQAIRPGNDFDECAASRVTVPR